MPPVAAGTGCGARGPDRHRHRDVGALRLAGRELTQVRTGDLQLSAVLWQNHVEAWQTKPFGFYLWTSVAILALNLMAVIGSASLCTYGFIRLNFPDRDLWFAIALVTMMLKVVVLVPSFVMFTRIGWDNTILPQTVPAFFGGGAFKIFLLRQFFRSLSRELADTAHINGTVSFSWILVPGLETGKGRALLYLVSSQTNRVPRRERLVRPGAQPSGLGHPRQHPPAGRAPSRRGSSPGRAWRGVLGRRRGSQLRAPDGRCHGLKPTNETCRGRLGTEINEIETTPKVRPACSSK